MLLIEILNVTYRYIFCYYLKYSIFEHWNLVFRSTFIPENQGCILQANVFILY